MRGPGKSSSSVLAVQHQCASLLKRHPQYVIIIEFAHARAKFARSRRARKETGYEANTDRRPVAGF